jgi:hypothetical protein
MDATYARVAIEHRAEGALIRLVLSPAALAELERSGDLDVREGDDGVAFRLDGVSLHSGSEPIAPVRLEVHLLPE